MSGRAVTECRLDDLAACLEKLQALLHEDIRVITQFAVNALSERVVADTEGAFVRERPRNLTLEVVLGLADQTGVVNETILRCVFLRFKVFFTFTWTLTSPLGFFV